MASLSRDSAPESTDTSDIRRAGRDVLSLALMDARNRTLHLLAQFEAAQEAGHAGVTARPGHELPVWVAGHIAWLSEYWIGRNPNRHLGPSCPVDGVRLASVEPMADRWFDPLLVPHAARWNIVLPEAGAVRAYLLDTLETSLELLDKAVEDDDAMHFFRAVLVHEDMRCEQLVEIAQSAGVPLKLAVPVGVQPREPLLVPAQRWTLGSRGDGYLPDIERGAHEVEVPEFEIDAQPVTWAQYSEFVDDNGYDDAAHWQPQGWHWLQREAQGEGRRGPRQVEQIGSASGAVMQLLFGKATRMSGSQSAMHLTWWEADAFARWAGRRLPTEVEWDLAAHAAGRRGFRWGDVREWTATTLRPWPGFVADAWTSGTPLEASPLFGAAKVQRGASFASRSRMRYAKARSFALPERDDAFVGFRTCAI